MVAVVVAEVAGWTARIKMVQIVVVAVAAVVVVVAQITKESKLSDFVELIVQRRQIAPYQMTVGFVVLSDQTVPYSVRVDSLQSIQTANFPQALQTQHSYPAVLCYSSQTRLQQVAC